jgi:tyrosine-protein phosphatase SIW14
MRPILALIVLFMQASPALANTANFEQVSPGIFRSGYPESQADYDKFKSAGIRTIVNLRYYRLDQEHGEREAALKNGFDYRHLPIEPALTMDPKNIEKAVALLADPSLRPILVHCRQGEDRTSLVVGIHRVRQEGWTKAQAYAEMLDHHFKKIWYGLQHYWDTQVAEVSALQLMP